jgi:threonine dehydratase
LLTLHDVYRAAARIGPQVRRTPVERSEPLSAELGAEVWLKLECWQLTGAFKLRGALNKLARLAESGPVRPVVTASAGNHGLGVAYAARLVGTPATVVVPETASPAKVVALQRSGVTLVQVGQRYDDAEEHALALARDRGLTYVSPYNDPDVMAGQGTIALELLSDLPDLDTLVVPVGGGGLIGGIAVAAKAVHPRLRIVGVQPEASPAIKRALAVGRIEPVAVRPTLADGLAGNLEPGTITLEPIQRLVDDVVLVSEEEIVAAMRALLDHHHLVVEGAGAVGLAALQAGRVAAGRRVALVLTGRNVATETLRRVLA